MKEQGENAKSTPHTGKEKDNFRGEIAFTMFSDPRTQKAKPFVRDRIIRRSWRRLGLKPR